MEATADVLGFDRVRQRIASDRELAKAIQEFYVERYPIYGYRLILRSRPGQASQVNEKLLWVIRVASSTIPIAEVEFDGDSVALEVLQQMAVSANTPAMGSKDRHLIMQQFHQKCSLLDSAIEVLSEHYNVFTLTPDGRYEDVVFHQGTQSLMPADELVGRYIEEVIGEHSADTVLGCLKTARETGKPQECFYDVQFESGERRWYHGRAIPPKDQQTLQLFLVVRMR